MTTKELIDRLLKYSPSSTRVDLRTEINIALNDIFSIPLEIMRIKDASTGKDPVLTTTAGVYEYEIDAAAIGEDAKYVTRVYLDGDQTETEECDPVIWTVRDGTGTGNATILFETDPGGTEYLISAYKHHPEIISETLPAELPFPQELINALVKIVTGTLEDQAHNRSVKLDSYYDNDEYGLRNKLNGRSSNVHYSGMNRRY